MMYPSSLVADLTSLQDCLIVSIFPASWRVRDTAAITLAATPKASIAAHGDDLGINRLNWCRK
jgi:hypothetical protein